MNDFKIVKGTEFPMIWVNNNSDKLTKHQSGFYATVTLSWSRLFLHIRDKNI